MICYFQDSSGRCFRARGKYTVQEYCREHPWEMGGCSFTQDSRPWRGSPTALFALVLCRFRQEIAATLLECFQHHLQSLNMSPLPELVGNDQELSKTRLEYFIAWLTTAPTSSCSQPWSQSDLPISNPNCPLQLTLPHLPFRTQGIISIHLHSASKKAFRFIVSPLSHNNPYFGSGKTL